MVKKYYLLWLLWFLLVHSWLQTFLTSIQTSTLKYIGIFLMRLDMIIHIYIYILQSSLQKQCHVASGHVVASTLLHIIMLCHQFVITNIQYACTDALHQQFLSTPIPYQVNCASLFKFCFLIIFSCSVSYLEKIIIHPCFTIYKICDKYCKVN